MPLRLRLVAVCCVLVAQLTSQRAFGLGVATDINYTTSSQTLSGYSRTWKDPWDADYSSYCLWTDSYGACQALVTTYYSVVAYAAVYSPTWSLYYSNATGGLRDAQVGYSFSVSAPAGIWTGQGAHYQVGDIYLCACYPGVPCGGGYQGSVWYDLGPTTDQAADVGYYIVPIAEYND